jgi:hypothetical protein
MLGTQKKKKEEEYVATLGPSFCFQIYTLDLTVRQRITVKQHCAKNVT